MLLDSFAVLLNQIRQRVFARCQTLNLAFAHVKGVLNGASVSETSRLHSSKCLNTLFAGYQGSFHSIQNCFHYGDCYRTMDSSFSSDVLSGESHCCNPLRQNGYHILSAPVASTGNWFRLYSCHFTWTFFLTKTLQIDDLHF